ncbi:MAG: CCA tRNA nucleotidyltransferase [Synechococcaceae cyanobacterium]|nr:CCA tRNA nucleotidyltransferase [Synechococcaceae cyanobacterium]
MTDAPDGPFAALSVSATAPAVAELPFVPLLLSSVARTLPGSRLALVGGAVRDLLLHRLHRDPWRGLPDLDLVVEQGPQDPLPGVAAAHRLAQALQQQAPAAPGTPLRCQFHDAFGTVELDLDGVLIDLATARRESYPRPAENPQVRFARLEDDLARRDLTINAMALVLGPGGEALLDPFEGQRDLALRRLHFLHEQSLRDDPTRLLRAARYAGRLGFHLSAASRRQASVTLEAWPWPWRPGDPPGQAPPALGTRLRMELELLLEREPWPQALEALQQWGGLQLLDPALQADRSWPLRLRWAARAGVAPLTALLAILEQPLPLAERLQLPHRQHRLLEGLQRLRQRLGELPPEARHWPPSRWSEVLEAHGWLPEVVPLALVAGLGPRRPLLRWWLRWRHLRSAESARDLIAAGMLPGPALGEALALRRRQRLDAERR